MRKFFSAVLAAAVLTSAPTSGAEDRVVNVYNWDNYIAPDTLARFTAETGIKVNYEIYPDNETLDTVLISGKSGYDVVFPSASPFFATQVKIGVFQPLDYSKIPNADGVDKDVLANLASVDRGNRHAQPFMIAATGFAYDVDRIKARVPGAPVDSWRMLFDPTVVAKVASCGVSLLDTAAEAVPAALAYIGRDPHAQTPDSLSAAMEVLQPVRPFVLQFVSTNYWDDLVAGTVCLSQGYVGDLVLARKKAREAVPPRTLAIVIPTEGAMINIDVMAVPADAPHPDEAMAFINFLLRPDIIAAISNETGYANAVPASKAMINADIKSDPVIFPTGAIKEKLFTAPPPANRDYNRARNRAWARFRAG